MKTEDHKVEYIQEYAKELTFGEDYTRLGDQLLILGEQHHRMHRLEGQVDFIIHDSPFIMGLTYLNNDGTFPAMEFESFVTKLWHTKEHINIFLKRNIEEHGYQEYGRSQSLDEAIQKDNEIKLLLGLKGIKYIEVEMSKNTPQDIFDIVKELECQK